MNQTSVLFTNSPHRHMNKPKTTVCSLAGIWGILSTCSKLECNTGVASKCPETGLKTFFVAYKETKECWNDMTDVTTFYLVKKIIMDLQIVFPDTAIPELYSECTEKSNLKHY